MFLNRCARKENQREVTHLQANVARVLLFNGSCTGDVGFARLSLSGPRQLLDEPSAALRATMHLPMCVPANVGSLSTDMGHCQLQDVFVGPSCSAATMLSFDSFRTCKQKGRPWSGPHSIPTKPFKRPVHNLAARDAPATIL